MTVPIAPNAAFAARLKSARLRTGKSQEDMAALVGTSRRNWLRWEGGYNMPSTHFIVRIAEVTGQHVDTLTGAAVAESSEDDDEESDAVAALMGVLRRMVREEIRSAA